MAGIAPVQRRELGLFGIAKVGVRSAQSEPDQYGFWSIDER
jgi:hypothetical protein